MRQGYCGYHQIIGPDSHRNVRDSVPFILCDRHCCFDQKVVVRVLAPLTASPAAEPVDVPQTLDLGRRGERPKVYLQPEVATELLGNVRRLEKVRP